MLSPFGIEFRRSLNAIGIAELLPLLLPYPVTMGDKSAFRVFRATADHRIPDWMVKTRTVTAEVAGPLARLM